MCLWLSFRSSSPLILFRLRKMSSRLLNILKTWSTCEIKPRLFLDLDWAHPWTSLFCYLLGISSIFVTPLRCQSVLLHKYLQCCLTQAQVICGCTRPTVGGPGLAGNMTRIMLVEAELAKKMERVLKSTTAREVFKDLCEMIPAEWEATR